jgi:hypothetical protein
MPGRSFSNESRRPRVAGAWAAISALGWAISALTPLAQADPPEILSQYAPAGIASAYGTLSIVRFSTGVVVLPPKVLAHLPTGMMRQLRFSENVWVLGYQTSISDQDGHALTENFICHTLFCDQRAVQRQDQRMRALYSDGFTRGFRLPDGYAVPFSRVDSVHFMPMFNNRTDQPKQVRMSIELLLIREKDLRKPLQPLYSTLRSVNIPHLYFVPPHRHEQEITFELPFAGRIHFIGTHIHPHAESISLFDVSRGQSVWFGKTKSERGNGETMETYSSVEGYPVHPGEIFRLSSVYNNPTSSNIDAMSAVFVYYSED